MEVSEFIYETLGGVQMVGAIFIDPLKVFDVIPHNRLLGTIDYIGEKGSYMS